MNHKEFYEKLSAYVSGDLSEKESAKMKVHLESCNNCKKEYAAMGKMVKLLQAIPKVETPPETYDSLIRRISSLPQEKTPEFGFRKIIIDGWQWKLVSAAIAVAIIIITSIYSKPPLNMEVSGFPSIVQTDNVNFKIKLNFAPQIASLQILNVSGDVLSSIPFGKMQKTGEYSYTYKWNSAMESGERVTNGIYYIRSEAGDGKKKVVDVNKMIVLRKLPESPAEKGVEIASLEPPILIKEVPAETMPPIEEGKTTIRLELQDNNRTKIEVYNAKGKVMTEALLPENFLVEPNPVSKGGVTSIQIQIPQNATVELSICDEQDKVIKSVSKVELKEIKKNRFIYEWNCRDENGRKLKEGTYFAKARITLMTGKKELIEKEEKRIIFFLR